MTTGKPAEWPSSEFRSTPVAQAAERVRGAISAARASRDSVDHPPHYTRGGIECIDVVESLGLGFHLGNALKYLWRTGHKDGADAIEDLEKACWYIGREIDRRRKTGG